ncbi:MAG TPA: DUF423 domain-containing protein [Sediminibacterium sp.]|uniref:DUF423 domain-containing protein n=1 Tax=Sediminibacterium sp. TaxID=1917865 RepID=UPI0008B96B40|nr:DUF423 domain-containing protein [Sediminibacterium sp.]OHC85320.1 MAG: hypothetical protein A2472_05995 [Sphingobacteriia bacterium RIFOXYC2_FULL_35_18]OHC89443.1 MAG: hypothetical protein A2546_01950 [Sphingobacteriia bacterium RIFOXYD2_FULL_35_12]HLD53610.1 DUF423 domain-containing protein [Sediminibacterium sp.]
MHKGFIIIASFLGALAVALGAFGAHGLKNYATPAIINTFETAVKYQFYHVFALSITGILYAYFPSTLLALSGKFFIAGIAIFSGSLYLLTLFSIVGQNQFKWLGAITPIGGLLLIIAWILMGISLLRYKA